MRMRHLWWSLVLVLAGGFANSSASGQETKPAPDNIPPTFANVRYGPHERNVLDVWLAQSQTPTPLVIFIHGGGFRAGSKEQINKDWLRQFLDAGISVAAINYRFTQHAPLPAAHHDAKRALQFLRWKAADWNIDPERIGAFGGSAGAQICLWLAFHDDMADPDSEDPVERQSTRLACVATMGAQTTLDLTWWQKHIPGYTRPHRTAESLFGTSDPEKIREVVREISALELVSPDDPPVFMTYGMAPGSPPPADPRRVRGWMVHHVNFGIALKEKCDKLGVEAYLQYPGAKNPYRTVPEFLIAKLSRR